MTSGKFQSLSISSIVVNRGDRQRKEIREADINDLALSISKRGLINPIVVTSDLVLVAGETRLSACRALGWTSIPAQFVDDLDPIELKFIELEENIKRKNLSWQDECLAVLELHQAHRQQDPTWTQQKTAEAIGLSQSHVGRQIDVAEELAAGNEKIVTADKFSVARNVVQRLNERKRATAIEHATKGITSIVAPEAPPEPEAPPPPIILADFNHWVRDYSGPKFNLIHCDFPYGINVAEGSRQNSVQQEYYDDSPDVYFKLLDSLAFAMGQVVADSSHLIFWFSMHHYTRTLAALTDMGWTVDPFPAVWHKSDNAGVAPDPQRRGRRTYETAFLAVRGDRKLTSAGARALSFAYPGKLASEIHMSAKPRPMLQHYMEMYCDEYSRVLDPTCGSGNALKVAKALGAEEVLGLEVNEEFYNITVDNWEK